jgi:uncharacterized membrane protein
MRAGLLRLVVALPALLVWGTAAVWTWGVSDTALSTPVDDAPWRALFAGVCHQSPDRSLWLGATSMIVCSRCAGIYAGLALAPWVIHLQLTRNRIMIALMSVGIINAIEWIMQRGTLPFHLPRLVAGSLLGCALGWVMHQSLTGRTQSPTPSAHHFQRVDESV